VRRESTLINGGEWYFPSHLRSAIHSRNTQLQCCVSLLQNLHFCAMKSNKMSSYEVLRECLDLLERISGGKRMHWWHCSSWWNTSWLWVLKWHIVSFLQSCHDRQCLAIHAKCITINPKDTDLLRDIIFAFDPENDWEDLVLNASKPGTGIVRRNKGGWIKSWQRRLPEQIIWLLVERLYQQPSRSLRGRLGQQIETGEWVEM